VPQRKIYFYRADVGADEGGRPLPFDIGPKLRQINGLPFNAAGRYLEEDDDTTLVCWVDRQAAPQKFRLGQVRRSGLPQVERAGALSDLPIPQDSGLAETIHIVVFDNNIVGSDFNFYGPRMSAVSRYLDEKANCQVAFEALLRLDVRQELDQLSDIRLFKLKIRAPYAEVVAAADQDLGEAFAAAARAGNADELEIILRPKKYSRTDVLRRALLTTARRLLGRDDLRLEASKFEIKGYDETTHKVEAVDLLRDQLIATQEIVRQTARGRALDPNSAYQAIARSYEELQGELQEAAGVVL